MKNKVSKKTISIALILVLLFSVFNIGKVLASEPTFKLSNALINEKSEGVEASIESFSNNKLVTNTVFHTVDDYVTYKLTIKNTSKVKYKLVLVNDNNSNDNVDYEYEYDKNEDLLPNSTIDVLLKTTYKKSISDMKKRVQEEKVKISFIIEDENGNVISEDIIHNPKTNDNILLYIVISVLSLVGLLAIVFRKKISKLFVALLIMLPIITYAVSPSMVLQVVNNVKLLDKVVINSIVNGEVVETIVDYNTKPEKPEDPQIEGYIFDNWYVGNQVYNFDKPLTDDVEVKAKFNIINYDINYDLDGGSGSGNPTTYNVETESFDLVNPTKEGYVFSGWTGSNGEELQTRVTIEKGTTGNKSYVAHYSVGQNTAYKVIHKYKKLDGTFETETENLTGVTGSEVWPAVKSKTGFKNPDPQKLTILADGSASIEYEYVREEYTLTLQNTEDIDTSFNSGKYEYETEIILTAKNKEHYDFIKWSNDSTSNPLVFKIKNDITVYPIYQVKKYTVSFNSHGGVDVNSITKEYNQTIDNLPETTKANYIFQVNISQLTFNVKTGHLFF